MNYTFSIRYESDCLFCNVFMCGPTLIPHAAMLLFHNFGEIEIVNCRLFSELIQVHNVLILTKLHIESMITPRHLKHVTRSIGFQ